MPALAQYLTRPILRLRDAAHAIARGNLEARAGLSGSTRRDEIADLVKDFDTMAGEIHDLVESNKRMLMGASHDLRSPISRIRVALSLASTAPEAERNELLGRIELELLRLNGMIEQILTVARLESGQLKPASEPLSLNQVIGEAVEDARFEASQSNVEVVYDDSWPEVTMTGEENMLRSAFENVLRNAIFYSGDRWPRRTLRLAGPTAWPSSPCATMVPAFPERLCPSSSTPSTASMTPAAPAPEAAVSAFPSSAARSSFTTARYAPAISSPTALRSSSNFPSMPQPLHPNAPEATPKPDSAGRPVNRVAHNRPQLAIVGDNYPKSSVRFSAFFAFDEYPTSTYGADNHCRRSQSCQTIAGKVTIARSNHYLSRQSLSHPEWRARRARKGPGSSPGPSATAKTAG